MCSPHKEPLPQGNVRGCWPRSSRLLPQGGWGVSETQAQTPGASGPGPGRSPAPTGLSEGCWTLFGQTLPHTLTFTPSLHAPGMAAPSQVAQQPRTPTGPLTRGDEGRVLQHPTAGGCMAPVFFPTFVNGLIPKELLSATWCKCSVVLEAVTENETQAPSCPSTHQTPYPVLREHLQHLQTPFAFTATSKGPHWERLPWLCPGQGDGASTRCSRTLCPGQPRDVQLVGKARSEQGKGPLSHLISPISVLVKGQKKHQKMPPFPGKSLICKCIKNPCSITSVITLTIAFSSERSQKPHCWSKLGYKSQGSPLAMGVPVS